MIDCARRARKKQSVFPLFRASTHSSSRPSLFSLFINFLPFFSLPPRPTLPVRLRWKRSQPYIAIYILPLALSHARYILAATSSPSPKIALISFRNVITSLSHKLSLRTTRSTPFDRVSSFFPSYEPKLSPTVLWTVTFAQIKIISNATCPSDRVVSHLRCSQLLSSRESRSWQQADRKTVKKIYLKWWSGNITNVRKPRGGNFLENHYHFLEHSRQIARLPTWTITTLTITLL